MTSLPPRLAPIKSTPPPADQFDDDDAPADPWQDVAQWIDMAPAPEAEPAPGPTLPPIERLSYADLMEPAPAMHPPVVDGLFRERETANIVSTTKVGKSWLMYSLALSIAMGRPWLGRFPTARGRVLIVDNELHRPTILSRIATVAQAMGIPPREYADAIEIWRLRANLRDIYTIGDELRTARGFRAIILDAKYRMMPPGASENDNAGETAFYNELDRHAEATGAAMICVHHSTKGDQSSKRITDVGAGAGAQSRAADCHLVIREHQDDGTGVLEAAVRSFPPVAPLAIRWEFPLWHATDADPARLRNRESARAEQQRQRDTSGAAQILDILAEGPSTVRQMRTATGMSDARVDRMIAALLAEKKVIATDITIRGNPTQEYRLARG